MAKPKLDSKTLWAYEDKKIGVGFHYGDLYSTLSLNIRLVR